MKSAKYNDWLQIFGLFGVMASLIFVGLQLKLDREFALSTATQTRTETTIQNIMGSASNPILASAIDKIESGDSESLLPSERRTLRLMGSAALFNLENVHFQYQNGFVPEERWVGSRQTLKGILRIPYLSRASYEGNPGAWRASFQEVVNELLAEIDSEARTGE